ncbi:secreted RxLR effector protein 161-like [Nicotiana tabacum]|uniref:Secreted RxLR effector protein 161-like n=1 Tax=Nicotiana tabacum TaxID=4097 RepID=A0AC58UQC0_TOBAC
MQDCRPGVAPVVKGDKLSKDQCSKNEVEMRTMKDVPYASVVGYLMYIQVCTRLDIAFAVNMLGRFSSNPRWAHWVTAKKVMRYLQRTKDFMLVYKKVDDLDLLVYSDSDFAGYQDTMKSTSLYIFILGRGVISWKSEKQSITATSTMESEFIACFETASHAVWMKNFLTKLQIVDFISKPVTIFCDNSASVFFSKNNKRIRGSKHVSLKFLKVRDMVKEGDICIKHISTESMLVDPLTKGLRPVVFNEHAKNMGILESFDVL